MRTVLPGDDLPQLPDGGNVQIRGRLIQHEDRRPKHTDRGTGNFLLFAAGELGDILPKQLFKLEVLNGLCEAAQYFPLLHADILAGKYDLRVGQKRIKLRLGILEHGADRPGQLMELELGGVISVHHDGDRNGELFGDVKAVHGSDKLADRGGREQHIKHGEPRKHLREDRRQRTGDDAENRCVQLAKEHRKHKAEHIHHPIDCRFPISSQDQEGYKGNRRQNGENKAHDTGILAREHEERHSEAENDFRPCVQIELPHSGLFGK